MEKLVMDIHLGVDGLFTLKRSSDTNTNTRVSHTQRLDYQVKCSNVVIESIFLLFFFFLLYLGLYVVRVFAVFPAIRTL